MLKLNKADEEILAILKETFLKNENENVFVSPDDLLRLWILKIFLALSVFCLFMRALCWLLDKDVSSISPAFSTPIALFFGILFLHINNKSENTSLIVFGLTWISIAFGLYV